MQAIVKRIPRAAVAVMVVIAVSVGLVVSASSSPDLAPISKTRLLSSSVRALERHPSFSGVLAARLDLGLPAASGPIASGRDPLSAFTGEHRVRIWRSSRGLKVADLLPLAERSVTIDRARREVWFWDSESFSAYRMQAPAGKLLPRGAARALSVALAPMFARDVGPKWPGPIQGRAPLSWDPMQLAKWALRALSGTTDVRVVESREIAGRAAYVLSLRPRDARTLVGAIEIGIDSETRLPLSVDVYPRGGDDPSISIAFESIDMSAPPPSTFRFDPPSGASVHTPRVDPGAARRVPATRGWGDTGEPLQALEQQLDRSVEVVGEGWSTVVAVRIPEEALRGRAGNGLDIEDLLPFSGPLFSAKVVERDGAQWLLVGAVGQEVLGEAEASLP